MLFKLEFKKIRAKNIAGYYITPREGYKYPTIEIDTRLTFEEQLDTLFHEYCHLILDHMRVTVGKGNRRLKKTSKDEEELCEIVASGCVTKFKKYLKGA